MNWKAISLLLLGVGLSTGGEVIPIFKTQKRTYENVVVKAVEPDGIRIAHDSGAARVSFEDLTPEQRETYGLTQEKRDEFVKSQNVARKSAARATISSPSKISAPKPSPSVKPETKESAPRYVTSDQIKFYWYRKLPTPRTMDPGFHAARKAREAFVADVRAGVYDLTAEKTAAQYNKQEALKFRDFERANLCETELARIDQQ